MKLCSKCGCINKDENARCADCGEYLFLDSSRQDAEMAERIAAITEKLANKHDYFHVSLYHKIVAALCAASFIASVAAVILRPGNMILLLYSAMMTAAGILEGLFPQFGWELRKFHLSFQIADAENVQPSDWQVLMRKIAPAGFLFLNIAGVIAVFIAG